MTGIFLLLAATLFSQPDDIEMAHITSIEDRPNDAGDALIINFSTVSSDDISSYILFRRDKIVSAEWIAVNEDPAITSTGIIIDGFDPDYPVISGTTYEYRIATVTVSGDTLYDEPFPAGFIAEGEWFNTDVLPVFVAVVLFILLIFYYFQRAKSGTQLYLRPISGIDAIDEAIGRATEMGKPILYVPGLSTIEDVATIASLTILSRVARKVAEYQTSLIVPNADPIVYTVAEESVKQAYMEAGRSDSYNPDSVFFITTSQFAYVAAVNGMMIRDKPATNFFLGMFWAESLLLAETGSLSGAIQIAGTDAVVQLPFFITTCDYTLIGEELYAASAYLGREPKQIAGVKGQDACKAIIMFFIVTGLILSTLAAVTGNDSLMFLRDMISVNAAN